MKTLSLICESEIPVLKVAVRVYSVSFALSLSVAEVTILGMVTLSPIFRLCFSAKLLATRSSVSLEGRFPSILKGARSFDDGVEAYVTFSLSAP